MNDFGAVSKNNLDFIFHINPELFEIGTKKQYSDYLKTIFPNSKLQDVYYHRTKSLDRFDSFDKNFRKKYGDFGGDAFYFAPLIYIKKIWDSISLKNATNIIYSVKLNVEKPYVSPDDTPKKENDETIGEYLIRRDSFLFNGLKDGTFDSIIDYYDDKPPYRGKIPLQILIYEPENIHILGSKKDLDGFRNFVKNNISEQSFMKKILLESTDEYTILEFLKNKIQGTEWENKVFLAGGAVRDEIMGKAPKDLDFTIIGGLDAGINFATWLGKELGNFKQDSNPVIYPKFGTAKLSLNNNNQDLPSIELEFVAPRKEEYRHGSRKPIVVAGNIEDDANRRDLTINSLLKNISTGEILDISGKGIEDIKNGVIRTTQDAEVIFKEDPLRMLRAIRFASKYNFDMQTDVIKNIRKNAQLINTISSERIRDEIDKMLMTTEPKKAFRLMKITGLLSHIIGEFDAAVGMKQNAHHKDDVFMHSMDVLSKTPPNLKTRLMGLFHDIGKTLTKSVSPEGSVHFYEHEQVGADMVKKIMTRLKYPNDLIDAVVAGVKNHMRLKHGGPEGENLSDKTLRKFVVSVGQNLEDILDLIHADNIAHSEHSSMPKQIEVVKKRLENLNMQLDKNKPKLPINGNDLIKAGFKQGKSIGAAMTAVEDAYYENPNLTYDEAIEIAKTTQVDNQLNEIRRIMNYLIK